MSYCGGCVAESWQGFSSVSTGARQVVCGRGDSEVCGLRPCQPPPPLPWRRRFQAVFFPVHEHGRRLPCSC